MDLSAFSLQGRRALVTGAGRGLGSGMAAGLDRAGAQVALVSRSEPELQVTAARLSAHTVVHPGDVSDLDGIPALVDAVEAKLGGPLDIVVHAAGIQHRESAEDFDPAAWDRVLRVNLTAPYLLSREIGRRQLTAERPGSHIFVGSLTTLFSVRDIVAYTASKSGIHGVARNLSLEWSSRGIRANTIGPGYIRTSLTEALFSDPARTTQLSARIPMGRFGEPDDMAGAVIFLASDASAYVTGQLLMVDGGWSAS